jgi:diacylglycerol kinase family enzyme
VIVNAHAGGGGTRDTVERALARAHLDATIVEVAGGNIEAQAARAIRRGDLLVAAGGDGTVSAVAAVAAEYGVPIAVLPTGTLNHFAKDTGIPTDPVEAAALLHDPARRRVDLGEANSRTFINNASLGIYPRLVWERNQEQRRGRRKWIAFAIALFRVWRKYRTLTVRMRIDEQEVLRRTPFVFIGNGRYHSEGLRLGGRERLDDGVLSVFVAPHSGRFDLLRVAFRALLGRLDDEAKFEAYTAQQVTIETAHRRLSVALDGEVTIARPPLRCRTRPSALEILVPGR